MQDRKNISTENPDFFFAAHTIEVLHSRRRVEILCALRLGPVRLGRLARMLPRVSKKVITENLRDLERSGIIVRKDLSGKVRHIEYDFVEPLRSAVHHLLTELGSFGAVHSGQGEERAQSSNLGG